MLHSGLKDSTCLFIYWILDAEVQWPWLAAAAETRGAERNNRRLANLSPESRPPPPGPAFYPEVVSAFWKAPPFQSGSAGLACWQLHKKKIMKRQKDAAHPNCTRFSSSAAHKRCHGSLFSVLTRFENVKKKIKIKKMENGAPLRAAAGLISPQTLLIARSAAE